MLLVQQLQQVYLWQFLGCNAWIVERQSATKLQIFEENQALMRKMRSIFRVNLKELLLFKENRMLSKKVLYGFIKISLTTEKIMNFGGYNYGKSGKKASWHYRNRIA